MSIDDRAKCLDTAKALVTSDRNNTYGLPEDSFKDIASLWSSQGVTVGGRSVSASDVALMMICVKLARLKHNPAHNDSWVDIAGYAACGLQTANVGKPLDTEPIPTFELGPIQDEAQANDQ